MFLFHFISYSFHKNDCVCNFEMMKQEMKNQKNRVKNHRIYGLDLEPMDGCKPQDAVEDKPCGVAGADGLLSSEDNKCLSEQYEEETLVIHEEEDIMSFESDKENGEEYLSDENELKKSVSPSGGHFESNREQPGTEGRPEISRHSYSRYDTVSYRKIRKGNTKQRIDEFESMMNL
uniref:Ermin n=1 Tax=Leptobrachium leishanense TaxID=445787 RepID=A0A8C5PYV7_9ANUR